LLVTRFLLKFSYSVLVILQSDRQTDWSKYNFSLAKIITNIIIVGNSNEITGG